MSIDVVAASYASSSQNEDRRIIPVRAVRDRVHHAAHCQIVVRHRGRRTWPLRASFPPYDRQENKARRTPAIQIPPLVRLARVIISGKFVQKLVRAKLVGIIRIEVRIQRIKVIAQHRFRRLDPLKSGTPHGHGLDAPCGSPTLGGNASPFSTLRPRTRRFLRRRRSLLR